MPINNRRSGHRGAPQLWLVAWQTAAASPLLQQQACRALVRARAAPRLRACAAHRTCARRTAPAHHGVWRQRRRCRFKRRFAAAAPYSIRSCARLARACGVTHILSLLCNSSSIVVGNNGGCSTNVGGSAWRQQRKRADIALNAGGAALITRARSRIASRAKISAAAASAPASGGSSASSYLFFYGGTSFEPSGEQAKRWAGGVERQEGGVCGVGSWQTDRRFQKRRMAW